MFPPPFLNSKLPPLLVLAPLRFIAGRLVRWFIFSALDSRQSAFVCFGFVFSFPFFFFFHDRNDGYTQSPLPPPPLTFNPRTHFFRSWLLVSLYMLRRAYLSPRDARLPTPCWEREGRVAV
jgi:hypothetical protein